MSNIIPGAKKVKLQFYETYVQIGELLSGNIDYQIIASLEKKFEASEFFVKLLIASCLSKIYMQIYDEKKAGEKLNYLRKTAPYCRPLLDLNQ